MLGFTLAEMLVAVAVLTILMAGFAMLFTGSVRTVRSTMQQTDAFDQASGALSSIKADLLGSFNGRDAGNKFSFYGTPIGMTFVGLVKNISDNVTPEVGQADLRLARVTYVLYHRYAHNVIPGAFENGADAYLYNLLRFVEPNAADLDSFPVQWDYRDPESGLCPGDLLDLLGLNATEEVIRQKKCEIWIRMLAGGDNWEGIPVPDAWSNPVLYLGHGDIPINTGVEQFVLTSNVRSPVSPQYYLMNPFQDVDDPSTAWSMFKYCYAQPGDDSLPIYQKAWWNDSRSYNCVGSPCADPCLPEIVSASFFLLFEAPYPSAPNFERKFEVYVNLPAAYTRQAIISGVVYKQDGSSLPDDVFMQVFPDPGVEVEVDATGYYSVAVPSGWSGNITLPLPLEPVDDDCADCVKMRTYENVTTSIKDQNYAVQ